MKNKDILRKQLEDCSFMREKIFLTIWDLTTSTRSRITSGIDYKNNVRIGFAMGKFVYVDDEMLVISPIAWEDEVIEDDFEGITIVIPRSCIIKYDIIEPGKEFTWGGEEDEHRY